MLELMIVMFLIVVLFTLYWSFAGKRKGPSRIKACQKNLQNLSVSLDIYATDHAGKFPVVTNAQTSGEALGTLIPLYTVDTTVFTCPSSGDEPLASGEPITKKKISYAYFMGHARGGTPAPLLSDKLVDTLPKTAGQTVFSMNGKPPGANHGSSGGNFLFTDGQVQATPPAPPFSLVSQPGIVVLNP